MRGSLSHLMAGGWPLVLPTKRFGCGRLLLGKSPVCCVAIRAGCVLCALAQTADA